MKKNTKLKAEIIKLLPDEWSYAERLSFFEDLAADYRKKSREQVYKSDKATKQIDYTPILPNGKG